ncbi:MAG TPA: hypothetical protein VH498_09170 [Candidatus Dormibacteraeota bacterium]|jgi:hypothetical protein|nr:hypothetical protein [Candidatus Dormibacteraeota bacterium]
MLAHILGGGPVWPLWITGTVLFGGGVAAMAVSGRLRRACLAASGVGLVATVAVYAAIPATPPAPAGVSLRIVSPPAGAVVTSPLAVRVCATGSAVPGSGRLLSISVDGRQVAEVDVDAAVVTVARGEHTLRVELVTTSHREYAPPLLTDETVTVGGVGVLTTPPGCAS